MIQSKVQWWGSGIRRDSHLQLFLQPPTYMNTTIKLTAFVLFPVPRSRLSWMKITGIRPGILTNIIHLCVCVCVCVCVRERETDREGEREGGESVKDPFSNPPHSPGDTCFNRPILRYFPTIFSFPKRLDRFWGPLSSLFNGYRCSFPRVIQPETWHWPLTPV